MKEPGLDRLKDQPAVDRGRILGPLVNENKVAERRHVIEQTAPTIGVARRIEPAGMEDARRTERSWAAAVERFYKLRNTSGRLHHVCAQLPQVTVAPAESLTVCSHPADVSRAHAQ